MGVKVYFIESTDIYGSIGFCGGVGFFSETDADQFEKDQVEKNLVGYSYMVNELSVKFSHRNGESEPPTEIGYYWIVDIEKGNTEKIIYVDCLEHHWREQDKLEWVLHDENPSEKARYFGPIPFPEEFL